MQYRAIPRNDDDLRLAMIRLAKNYGRYGYRKVLELLRIEGWCINHKKLERLWSEEGLQQPLYAGLLRGVCHFTASVLDK